MPVLTDTILDSWALALIHDPDSLTAQWRTDALAARATAVSREAFGRGHSRRTADQITRWLQAEPVQPTPPVLNARQVHLLFTLAAAPLLAPDQIADLLNHFVDPGIDVHYRPVSASALARSLHTVLARYPTAKRARLLRDLLELHQQELATYAPTNTKFSDEFMAWGARHADLGIRAGIARCEHLPSRLQFPLALDFGPEVREALAGNPALVGSLQTALADDEDPYVRAVIARRHDLVPGAEERIRQDDSPVVRRARAGNPSLSVEAQHHLFAEAGATELLTLARNPALAPSLQERMAASPDPDVRRAVAMNEQLLPHLQERLVNDPSPGVWALAANPALQAEHQRNLYRRNVATIDQHLAANPRLDAGIVPLLIARGDRATMFALARRTDLCNADRAALGEQPVGARIASERTADECADPHDRLRVACSPHLPASERAITAPAITRLATAVAAVRIGAEPPPRQVRDAATLPSLDDIDYPTAAAAAERIEGGPLSVRVLRNGREQRRHARQMHNCLGSDRMVGKCQRGDTIVATLRFEGQPFDISWRHSDRGVWIRTEVSGYDNAIAPAELLLVTRGLTDQLRYLMPRPAVSLRERETTRALLADRGAAGSHPHSSVLER